MLCVNVLFFTAGKSDQVLLSFDLLAKSRFVLTTCTTPPLWNINNSVVKMKGDRVKLL